MSEEPESAGDKAGKTGKTEREYPKWVLLLIFPVIATVLGAVLVTAFTPLGTSVRELLFHTRATVAGSVTMDGKPAVNAHLKLDGTDWGNTDADGRFLLTEVGKGQHRLHLELLGAKPRDKVFSVASGQTALQVGNLEMEPLVQLAYTPIVHMSAQQYDYDITLWIIGDPGVLRRIKSVLYTLPIPLSPRPVSGASARHAFCYRQAGSISFQDAPLGNSAPVLALAVVDLGGGEQFQISAPAGKAQPPDCPAHQVGSAPEASTTPTPSQQTSPAQGQQQSPSPSQTGSSPASSTAPPIEVPNVIGLPLASAIDLLRSSGFTATPKVQSAPDGQSVAPGIVWSQNPAPGPQKSNSTVSILVQPLPTPTPTPTP
jgi:hypothetical protein